jgi:PAS domain S-box-containing protein
MNDQDRTREQLLAELAALRQRIGVLEQTEGALRESEERFRKVFDEGPLGVVLLGLDIRIRRCNRRFCEMMGCSEEEIIALGLVGISHPEDWEKDFQFGSRLLRGEIPTYTIDKRYVRKEGTVFWGQLTVSMMHDAEGKSTMVIGMIEDITERKQAEESLRSGQRTLRTLIDASPEVIVLADTKGTVLIANETAARRLGTTVDKMTGQGIHAFVAPEVGAQRMKRLREVIRTGEAVRFEDQRSGSYFEIAMHPVFEEAGKVAAVAILAIDQTARKRAETALQQAHDELERRVEERTAELTKANEELTIFRRFAEASGEGFGMSEMDGRIVYVNSTLCRLFGEATPQDVIGKQVSTYYPQKYASQRNSEMLPALLREGGYWHAEQTVLPRHGEPILTSQSTFLIRDESGNPFRIAVVISDITERKRAEEALRRSEEKHRGLLEACPDAVVMTDLEGRILFASRQTWQLVGLSDQEDLVGQSVFDYVIEEDRRRLAENIPRLVQTGVRRNAEYTALRQDGTTAPTEISSAINQDPAGQPIAVTAVIRDITERKRAEEILRSEHRTLKYLLQSSDHERQLIAYEIHDGLAQYLAGALMQFDVYTHLKETKPKDAAKAYEAGMTMLRQGHFEARRLISGLRPPILDEEGIVAAVAHLVGEERRKKGPKIEYGTRVEFQRLAPILENAVYRIAQEALTNAYKHSQSKTVRIKLVQQGDRLRIEVHDRGVGFRPEDIKEGQFGLAGIRERARLLGGKATIDSKVGKGTRVVVEVPIVARTDEGKME